VGNDLPRNPFLWKSTNGDCKLVPKMIRHRSNPVAWLTLMVLTINAVVPMVTRGWVLCIGCDELGWAVTRIDALAVSPSDPCCGSADEPAERRGESSAVVAEEEFAGDCGCFRVTGDGNSVLAVLPTPHEGMPEWFTPLMSDGVSRSLITPRAGLGQRGPPECRPRGADRTLIGLHTSLLI